MSRSNNHLVVQPLQYKTPVRDTRCLIDPEFPMKTPFMTALIGKRGSGKSTLLVNLFRWFGEHFRPQDVILISPSIHTDPAMEMIPAKYKYDSFSTSLLESVILQQKALIAENRYTAPDLLIILDDCITEKSFNAGSVIEMLGYRGRHLKMSCIFSVQKYSALSRGIRLNCSHLIFYKVFNKSELKWILDEHSDTDSRAAFKKMLDYCWKTPYSFLFVDYWSNNDSERYRKNFDEVLDFGQFNGSSNIQISPINEDEKANRKKDA